MVFKEKKENIIYTSIMLFIGLVWFLIYNHTNHYPMYKLDKNGVLDTTNVIMVAPRYTKKIYSRTDTLYFFFNKKRKMVKKIEKDSLKFYIIKNYEDGI